MELANYIVFHPDKSGKTEIRQKVEVSGAALIHNKLKPDWKGSIYVDKINDGNEDPFVLTDPWLYSYCHASQLRRKNWDNRIDVGSVIIFVSGDYANKSQLVIDTVFVVDKVHEWGKLIKISDQQFLPILPNEFKDLYKKDCELWNRHFKYPFEGQHVGVTHTYSAELWTKKGSQFSFLPINASGERVGFPISSLNTELANKINQHVKGKIPVWLTNAELSTIMSNIENLAHIKVIRNIKLIKEVVGNGLRENCSIC